MDEGKAKFDVLHLLLGIFAIPGIERLGAALGVRHQEWKFTGADDRKAARLVAGIDVRDVSDANARHVIVVERLAELLGREYLGLDRPAGRLVDCGTPIFKRLLKRMRGRHPVRDLQVESLFLRKRWRDTGGHKQRQKRCPHRHLLPLVPASRDPLQVLLYDIIIMASLRLMRHANKVGAYNIGESKYCGQK